MIITAPIIIVSLQPKKRHIINNGAIVTDHNSILAVGPADKLITKFIYHRVHSLKNVVLMPGLVNLHTHLELPHLLDSTRASSFSGWVMNLIMQKKKLGTNDYQNAASNNVRAAIESGTTTVGEICTHGVSPLLLKQSGMRAVVFHEIIAMGTAAEQWGLTPIPAWNTKSPLLQFGLSPHSPYTVAASTLRKIKEASEKRRFPVAMHVAESLDEIRLLQRKKNDLEKLYQFAKWDPAWAPRGDSSFAYLKHSGFLTRGLIAVHAVQVTNDDIRLIKKAKVSVAHCPRSNKELGVGKMPLKKMLDAGITVGLGTDSLASSPNLNMWDEMRYAYLMHKRDGVSAEDIFRLATINGASALGLDSEIGALEPGKKADLIAVPLPKKDKGDLYSDLLRETKSCIMTMVNGKILHSDL